MDNKSTLLWTGSKDRTEKLLELKSLLGKRCAQNATTYYQRVKCYNLGNFDKTKYGNEKRKYSISNLFSSLFIQSNRYGVIEHLSRLCNHN